MWHIYREKLIRELPTIPLIVLIAKLPVFIWLGRNYLTLYDILGTAEKMSLLTWSVKLFFDFGVCHILPVKNPFLRP